MRPTRRKMVLGMGALATGSGAVFSSAAFQSSVNPTADMRVVVEDDLVVEAGASFRGSGGAYLEDPSEDKFYGTGDGSLFSSSDSLDSVEIDDLPAARVNDDQNGGLYIETAVKNRDENGNPIVVEFPDLLRVRNNGTETAEVGISYQPTDDAYGANVVNGGSVSARDVVDAYVFESEGGSGGKISPDTYEGNPANTTTVGVGETEQIGLTIDLGVGSGPIVEDIAEAASPGTSDVFNGGEYDTVELLKQIRVGNTLSAGDQ